MSGQKHVSGYYIINLHSYTQMHWLVFIKNFKHLINAKEHGTKKYIGAPKYIILKSE